METSRISSTHVGLKLGSFNTLFALGNVTRDNWYVWGIADSTESVSDKHIIPEAAQYL